MKLYYSPFACSLASHIACREAGLEFELQRAELTSKRVEGGGNLHQVNPMGQVPTLVTDDGRTLTENSAVLLFLADRAPARGLAPSPGAIERYELLRWLSFIGTEVHKRGLALIFGADCSGAVKDFARAAIHKPLGVAEAHLKTSVYLMGPHFTVADAYLFWALTIAPRAGIDLGPYTALRSYQARQLERPAVRAAVGFERDVSASPFASGGLESGA